MEAGCGGYEETTKKGKAGLTRGPAGPCDSPWLFGHPMTATGTPALATLAVPVVTK